MAAHIINAVEKPVTGDLLDHMIAKLRRVTGVTTTRPELCSRDLPSGINLTKETAAPDQGEASAVYVTHNGYRWFIHPEMPNGLLLINIGDYLLVLYNTEPHRPTHPRAASS